MNRAAWLQRARSAARRLDPRGGAGTFQVLTDPDEGTFGTAITLRNLGERTVKKSQDDAVGGASGDEDAAVQVAVWVVDAAEIGTVIPKVGDRITDTRGATPKIYSVRQADGKLLKTRYRLICVEVLA